MHPYAEGCLNTGSHAFGRIGRASGATNHWTTVRNRTVVQPFRLTADNTYEFSVARKLFCSDVVAADAAGDKHLPHRCDHARRAGSVVDGSLQVFDPFRQHLRRDMARFSLPWP